MDLIQLNIENATRLWATAAMTFDRFYETDGISYGYIPESQWPNKIWLHGTPSLDNLQKVKAIMAQRMPDLTLVYFDKGGAEVIDSLRRCDFNETFFLHGMSLRRPFEQISQSQDIRTSLEFKAVTRTKERRDWVRAFETAFRYSISEETLARTQESIRYYLLRARGKTIGTLAFFWTGSTAGIYSMGIVPEARGQGYALEAMQLALNQAASAGAESVVLQASAMGLPIYEKLGFTTDFIMRNYTIKSQSYEIT